MFYKYEIINNGSEQILYLYLNTKYEFANDFSYNDDITFLNGTNDYIQKNNINFKGNKVYYVIDGIVVKKLNITNRNIKNINPDFSADNYMVIIRLDDNSLCEVSLRNYLISILFFYYMNNINDEVLKAIAILYITYAYKMMKENNFISSNNNFVVYKELNYYKDNYFNFSELEAKFNIIIDEVDCIFMKYDNEYILPFIHYSNIGKTIEKKDYPYLSSVKSLWDLTSPYFINYHDYGYNELSKKLNIKLSYNDNYNIDLCDGIKKIIINDYIFTAEEIKNILNLKSSDIYLIINKNYLRIITMGWGNSYGLSIYGANMIALDGGTYYDILHYYFPKVLLYRYSAKDVNRLKSH